jgi:predicted TIM-barrel fold metal-dependent hydrolase
LLFSPEPALSAISRIVDAHFHLWDLDENYYPWLCDGDRPTLVRNFQALRRNYLIADFLRDAGELPLIGAVHVQAEHDPKDPVRETRWLQKVADRSASRGFPQAIIADADFASPDIEHVLEQHCAFPNMRGIRHALHRRLGATPPYDPLEDPAWTKNFPLLKTFGLSFDMQLFPQQAGRAVALIRANPHIQIILTHCGMPFRTDLEGRKLWRQSIRAYAALPNTAIKISGFGGYDESWNIDSIDPIVSAIVEAFGPRRCMLASNFPVEGLVHRYGEIWRIYRQYFSEHSQDERDGLFWRNAAAIYRLDLV